MQSEVTEQPQPAEAPRLWRPQAWRKAASVGKNFIYDLPEHLKPRSRKVGRVRLIEEDPVAWLRRVGR